MKYFSISASLGIATAAAVLAAVEAQEEYDAVIVGAGWAGLRAADTLLKRGVPRVLVLEATGRVGGRAWSKNGDGTENNPDLDDDVVPYDLGVEWNYDSEINEQQDVLWDEGAIDFDVWVNQEYMAVWPTWPRSATYYQQAANGTAAKLNEGDNLMVKNWAPFLKFRDDNLDDLFGQSYGETIEQYEDREGITDNESLQFLNLIRDAKHLEYGTDGFNLDITEVEFTDPTFHVETNYMGRPGLGWGNIAAKYGEKFASNVKKRSKVTEINTEDLDYVVVTYERKGETRRVKARTVLVTVSIGVLKAGNIKFVPSLPDDKQESIAATGFGVINKCIMSWKDETKKVWPDEAEEDKWFLMTTPDDETSGKWTTFSNPSRYKGMPSLTAWIGGKDAVEAEKMSDNEIFRRVMKNLRAMFPTIGVPDNAIITRWGQEENVLGAYSFPSPGQDFYKDMEIIGRREGNVYFAGEGTSENGWATTFGAWDSGEKAAKEMSRRIYALVGFDDRTEAPSEDDSEDDAEADTKADTEPISTIEKPPEPQTQAASDSPPATSGEDLPQYPGVNIWLLVGLCLFGLNY